jgi:patatin-related protein
VEHRLALVMNGGVSLAVWMGGVAREIDAARRASNGIAPPGDASAGRRRAHELWTQALTNAGVRLTVDVIAGTSAGGLNGVLLATAIARGTDLAPLKQLWHDSAQMSTEALFTPRDRIRSLMNGAYFKDEIGKILGTLTAGDPDDGRDVTLIVTATALGSSARPVTDSDGRPFLEADHRRRFRFARNAGAPRFVAAGGAWAFEPGTAVDDFTSPEPLATAGRASASFPAAFEPQHESALLRAQRVFPDWETSPRLEWLADGGILDNSPFDPVLDAIEAQHVSGQWQRTLVYVVPSAEEAELGKEVAHAADPAADGEPVPPPWTSVVLSALNLPRESDFRDDIERLHRTIRFGRASFDVQRFRQMTAVTGVGALTEEALGLVAAARQVSTSVMPLYRQTSRSSALYQVRDLLARSFGGYLEPTVDDTGAPDWPGPRPWLPDFPAAAGADPAGGWQWGVDPTERVLRVMLRSLRESAGADTARADLSSAIAHVAAVGRAVDDHLVEALAPLVAAAQGNDIGDDAIVKQLDDTYTALDVPGHLEPFVTKAVTSYATYLGAGVTPADVLCAGLAIEVSNGAGSLPSERARPIFSFDRLGLDAPPPPLDLHYRTALTRPGASAGKILYGTRLSHFAAFGAPEWRDWDWMWGRLCGLANLARVLGLADADVKELTIAIIAEELELDDGWDRLPWVQGQIDAALETDFASMRATMRDGDVLAQGLDAVLAFVGSSAATEPALPSFLPRVGRYLSDALSRHDADVEHDLLRLAVNALPEPHLRAKLWRAASPPEPD